MKLDCLSNDNGMRVLLADFGARVVAIEAAFARHQPNMTLTYPALADYHQDAYYLGATIGRVANRIRFGQFQINGKCYQVSQNEGVHCLHGGSAALSHRYWQVEHRSDSRLVYR